MNWRTTALLTIGLVACGDDTEKTGDTTSAPTTTAPTDATVSDINPPADSDGSTGASDTSVEPDATVPTDTDDATVATDTVADIEPDVVLTPPDLTCVAAPIVGIVPQGARTTVAVTSFVTGEPMADITVSMCAAGDIVCDTPLQALVTDATGEVVLTHNPALGATSPYIQLNGEAIAATRYLPNPGITRGGVRKLDVYVIETKDLESLGEIFGASTPNKAHVLARAVDCAGVPAPLSTLSVDTAVDSTTVVYIEDAGLNGLTTTSASGLAGIIDVPAGEVATVTASYDGDAFGSYSFRPEADIIYQFDVTPGPVVTTEAKASGVVTVFDLYAEASFAPPGRAVRFSNAPDCVLFTHGENADGGELSFGGTAIDVAQTLSPAQCSTFYSSDFGIYTMANSSSIDVALEGNGSIPNMPTQTVATSSPDLVEVLTPVMNPDTFDFSITAGQDFVVDWTPPATIDPATRIIFAAYGVTGPAGAVDLLCAYDVADGEATIPANVTAEMALRTNGEAFGIGHVTAGGATLYESANATYFVEASRAFDSTTLGGNIGAHLVSDLLPPPPPPDPVIPLPSGPAAPGTASVVVSVASTEGAEVDDIAFNSDGSFIAVGRFDGSMTIGLDALTSTAIDGFVAKYTAAGAPVWAHAISSPGFTTADNVSIASDGSIYVSGMFGGDLAITAPPTTPVGGNDVYLVKYQPDGTQVWARTGGGPGYDTAYGLETIPDGAYLVGSATGSGSFGDEDYTVGTTYAGAYIVYYDAAGTVNWLTIVGDGESADVDLFDVGLANGRLVVAGNYQGELEAGDRTLSSPCGVESFWLDVNLSGAITAAHDISTPGFDAPFAVSGAGTHAVITARLVGAATIDGAAVPAPDGNSGVAIHLSTGATTFESMVGPHYEDPTAVDVASDGSFVVGGVFGAGSEPTFLSLGAGEANATVLVDTDGDGFVARYDSAGLVWARALTGPSSTQAVNAVAIGAGGAVAAAGFYGPSIVFDATHSLVAPFPGKDGGFVVIYE